MAKSSKSKLPPDDFDLADSAPIEPLGSVPVATVEMIAIAELDRGGNNHRLASPADKQAIASLAKRLADEGQLQPVRVYKRLAHVSIGSDDKKYVLGFGFRRCAALELNDQTHVRAEVIDMPYVDGKEDWFEIHRIRTIENLERENLNPMEEQIAVAEMLEALPTGPQLGRTGEDDFVEYRNAAGFTADAFDRVALSIGRPVAWVRDRAYLARLSKPVQQLLIAGKLPIAHAREIAKLGSAEDQLYIASQCTLSEDGHGGRALNQIRLWVNDAMKSLRIVPWKLEDHFAQFKDNKKICGACVGCRFNTATDRNLFEHDDRPPEDGLCMNKQCLDEKHKVAEKKLEKAVASIVKQELPATAKSAESVQEKAEAEFLKPTAIANRAKKVVPAADGKPAAAKPSSSKKPDTYEDRVRVAESKFNSAIYDWGSKVEQKVFDAAKGDPRRMLAIVLLCEAGLPGYGYGGNQKSANGKKLRAAMPAIEAMINPGSDALAAFLRFLKEHVDMRSMELSDLDEEHAEPLVDALAENWSIELPPKPKKEDFMPAKPAAAKTPAKPAKSKK